MGFLTLEKIARIYGAGDACVAALNGIDLTVDCGEFVAIMGESGAGKSTLLSVMGAMNTPTSGLYQVDDIDVYALGTEQRADFRREYLGFVFQSFHLIPYLTVLENVLLPITPLKLTKKLKIEMALQALSWVGLDGKAKRLPNQISGGEKERVAIARAIVNNPPVLLADEPTGNLDTRNSQEIMALLSRLRDGGTTVIMVTHSPSCAAMAQRIVRLRDGRLDDTETCDKRSEAVCAA